MGNAAKKWNMRRVTRLYLFVLLALGALVVLPAGETHAWGVYSGMHGDGIGTVSESQPGTHFGGMTVGRDEVLVNVGTNRFDTYAYINFISSGLDAAGNRSAWAGNGENLNNALVYLRNSIISGASPLTLEIYHISDDSWKGSELTWANQPLQKDINFFPGAPGATETIATLLTTQTITGGDAKQYFNLLAAGSPYLDIWNSQDKSDHVISLMFKLSGSDLGKASLWQDSYSLTLEGTSNSSSVPIPGALWLLAPGLVGLIGLKRKYLG